MRSSGATSARRCRRNVFSTRTWYRPPCSLALTDARISATTDTFNGSVRIGSTRRLNLPLRSLLPRRHGRGKYHQGIRQLHQRLIWHWCWYVLGQYRGRGREHGGAEEGCGVGAGQSLLEEFGEFYVGRSFIHVLSTRRKRCAGDGGSGVLLRMRVCLSWRERGW